MRIISSGRPLSSTVVLRTILRTILRTVMGAASIMLFTLPNAAFAEIKAQSENGFAILYIGDVASEPEDVWRNLMRPNRWWDKVHSWSGKSENFYLEPNVGGCFCENFSNELENGTVKKAGAVEHLRIIHINQNKVLRMTGALGPLQSEAVNGTLTIAMKANGDGTTQLSFSYIVGGYMRYKTSEIASAVDKVIGLQFINLVKLHGDLPTILSDDLDAVEDNAVDLESQEAVSEDENISDKADEGDAEEDKTSVQKPATNLKER